MNDHVNPIFRDMLNQFCGQFQPASRPIVTIAIEKFEIELGRPGLMANDPENTNLVMPSDLEFTNAVEWLLGQDDIIDRIEQAVKDGRKP